MTVASIAPGASSCTLPPPPLTGGGPTTPPPVTGGGGTTPDLPAAIEQVRVAVDQLAQVVNAMQTSGGGAVSGGGGTSGGCGMSGCGGGASGGGDAAGGGAMGAPSAPAAYAATAAPAGNAHAAHASGGGAPAAAAASAPGLSPNDSELAKRIDEKVLAGTGLAGKGAVIVAACRKYNIPVDFALAVYQKEASFAKSGTLADKNNNPGNLRFADWQKEHGGAPNGGFTKYPTMDDGINASMHLLSLSSYKDAVARRDWGAVINKYAPSSENDTQLYIKQMNEYTANFRQKLGIGEDWLRT